jgi:hypothetical protein
MSTHQSYRLATLLNQLHPTEAEINEMSDIMHAQEHQQVASARSLCFLTTGTTGSKLRVEPPVEHRTSDYVWRPGHKRMTREKK